uniref:Uncharacterized protein n=1 Tax=Meloidogyne javanica TaxID=6303 RepID=A0A915N515_MELJA
MNKKSFNEVLAIAKEAAAASIGSDLMKNCFERVKNICDNGFTTKENFEKALSLWKCLESITVHLDHRPLMPRLRERVTWPKRKWTYFRSSSDYANAFWRIFDTDPIAVVKAAAGQFICRDNSVYNEIEAKITFFGDSDIEEDDIDRSS